MADAESYTKQPLLVKEQKQANPSKYYTHFLYKAFIVVIFLVIIPVFPSQAPEFINRALLNRSWELLHLLFVGIAVCYGLFSRRNDETEKENSNNQSKVDNVQSVVSRFLQVSSVFDDEAENLSGSDETKVQTWNNRYYRNENPVVVATEQVVDKHRSSSSKIAEKPLLLPVRRLKSRVLNANNVEMSGESSANSPSLSRSNSSLSSKRFNKVKNGEFGGFDGDVLDEKMDENNVVLPSPIPWRSRSGRMEVKDDIDSEFNRVETRSLRSQTTRLSRSNSLSSSGKKLSSSPPLSMEAQAKSAEHLVRKKNIYRSPPPPPPLPPPPPPLPPPPPPLIYKSPSLKPSSIDDLSKGKSVRTPCDSQSGTRKNSEIENGINGKTVKFDEASSSSSRIEKLNRETLSFMPNPTFMEFPHEEKQEFIEKLEVETTDDDSESEDDEEEVSNTQRNPINEEASPSNAIDGASDVDKKAEEFIAKVREQIRLQRIDSIKRSSGQMKRNSTR